jgi:hypothetical protein
VKNKKLKQRYVVTKDGVDCGFATAVELGLGHQLLSGVVVRSTLMGKRGVLVKKPERPFDFASEKQAQRFIGIAERCAAKFRGTLVDELPKLRPLIEGGVFAVRTMHR